MPKERYYFPQLLSLGQQIRIEGAEYHHLTRVMRSAVGDTVELINGQGNLGKAKILHIGRKDAVLTVESLEYFERTTIEFILVQAIPKINRLDYIVEKGTELGMSALWLFPGERSDKKELSKSQLARLQLLAIAAMKQCGRLYLPDIQEIPSISNWCTHHLPLYFGSLDPKAPLLMQVLQNQPSQGARFCVGPEAGLSQHEEKVLESLGGIGVKLHSHILRTETAAITGLTILVHTSYCG